MSSQRVSGTAVQRTIAVGPAVFFVVAQCTVTRLVPLAGIRHDRLQVSEPDVRLNDLDR